MSIWEELSSGMNLGNCGNNKKKKKRQIQIKGKGLKCYGCSKMRHFRKDLQNGKDKILVGDKKSLLVVVCQSLVASDLHIVTTVVLDSDQDWSILI